MAAVPKLEVSDGGPALQLGLRHRGGVHLAQGPPTGGDFEKFTRMENGGYMKYSKDGSMFGVATPESVSIFDTSTGALVQTIEKMGCRNMFFSPQNTFIVTFERYVKSLTHGNISVWLIETGEEIVDFTKKVNAFHSGTRWGPQWSDDEAVCANMFTNEVRFYDGKTMTTTLASLRVVGCEAIELAPGFPVRAAVYTPEKKGAAATVKVFTYPNLDEPTAIKGFMKADDVDIVWSPNGGSLLIGTRTDVDQSGKSYYGESHLYFLRLDGGLLDCQVPLLKDGPVSSYQWSPNGSDFIVVHGTTPAKCIMYNGRCEAKFDFGDAHRNEVKFSPHGRFVMIGGFGNMAGEMDFWDTNKKKKMGSAQAPLAHCFKWSPDGRYFLTACLAPRMQVDHGYTIYSYDGEVISSEAIPFLYEVDWRPALEGVFPNRPMSPRVEEKMKTLKNAPAQPAVSQKYVPPGARRKKDFGLHKGNVSVAKKIEPTGDSGEARMSKSAWKAKKKKEKAAAAKAQKELQSSMGIEAAPEKPKFSISEGSTIEELEKRVKQLTKKVRQIDALFEKQKDGATLTPEQATKVETKPGLVEELHYAEGLLDARKS